MTVLVVEDDEAVSEALVGVLRDAGYDARGVPDGRRALEILSGGANPCLILLDLSMPGMDGWRFREEQLRNEALAHIPVILCTADVQAEQRARELRAAGWLRKPLDPEHLLKVIEGYCPPAPPA